MSSSHSKVGALLGGLKTHIPALGQFVQRHSHQLRRAGTFSAAFVSIALGGLLCVAPFGEFASGEDLHWTSIVSLVWLVMALAMVAAGFAVLLRMHAFRRLYQVSFLCSLPVAGYFLYEAIMAWVAKGKATGSEQEELAILASGLFLVSFAFGAITAFLFFLMRWHVLQLVQCSPAALTGRFAPVIAGVFGAFVGGVSAVVLWLVCRWLAASMGIAVFQTIIAAVRFELFVLIGAVPAAGFAVWRRLKGSSPRSHSAPHTPSAPSATVLP